MKKLLTILVRSLLVPGTLVIANTACAQLPVEPAWQDYATSDSPVHPPWTAPIANQAAPAPYESPYDAHFDANAWNTDSNIRLAEAPGLPATAPFGPTSSDGAPNSRSLLPPGTRPGMFQKLNFGTTYLPNFDDDSIGITQFETSVLLGLPFPDRESPLLITPSYGVRFVDGPMTLDVPARLHDAEIDFHHFRRISDRWIFDTAVTVGVYADDESFSNSDAVRVSGRALGIYELSPVWKGIIGVVYLNRAGASVVPAVGLQYDTPDIKYDLVFPRPRAAYRIWNNGPPGVDERWLYAMAEFGGGIWSVQRASGIADTLSSSDYRLLIGTERKIVGGISRKLELGYVFGRELEYDSGAAIDLDDTLLVRMLLTY